MKLHNINDINECLFIAISISMISVCFSFLYNHYKVIDSPCQAKAVNVRINFAFKIILGYPYIDLIFWNIVAAFTILFTIYRRNIELI